MTLTLRRPPGVLGEIVARTVADLDVDAPVPPREGRGTRSLAEALMQPGLGLIAEVKPRSPSEGPLRDLSGPHLDTLLRAYRPAADAISVLIDGPAFGGSLGLLRQVRDRVEQPVLAKGFFVHPAQLRQAHAAGADAVLLMASVLPPASLREMLDAAAALGLDCLVEAHDDRELDEVLESGAAIVGVNSRDLASLQIDRPACIARLSRVPADRARVAESGLHTAAHIDAVRPVADAVLIGTALVRSDDPRDTLAALGLSRPHPGGLP